MGHNETDLVYNGELVGHVTPKPGEQPMPLDQRTAIARHIKVFGDAPELRKAVDNIIIYGRDHGA